VTAKAHLQPFSLEQKYAADGGVVLINGIQALVRALQTRARLDRANGLNIGGFVSGYRGSPLGGLDKELWACEAQLEKLGVRFQPGVNEDLAATAVWGSQQVGLHEGATVQGAFGMWYGKAPGLDRSCDAIRHANAWGTSAHGGVLLVVGDDPAAKSSSLATQSEFALQDMMVPILYPADVQDVLDFAVLGWEMSRRSGLWVGLKAIADHMDSAATVDVGLQRYPQAPATAATDVHIRVQDTPAEQEQRLLSQKLPAAIEFARQAGVNRWITQSAEGRSGKLGIICAGKAYRDVREACAQLGLCSAADLGRTGIEILKLGMTWPLDAKLIEDFADSVQTLLVVEEKRAFVEPQVKEILYGRAQPVPVLGKRDQHGRELLGSTGILEVSEIARILATELQLPPPQWLRNVERTQALTGNTDAPAKKERTPLFCAGCPHNTSTRVPEGSRATAGIGCHYMVQWMDRDTDSCTQMGGEGVTWVGEAPFTSQQHIFANLGDGTYFHSGILAIRQAVAAGVNITYKILFNDAVAMTGGQPTDGDLDVADVVAQVRAEGVSQIVVVSDAPQTHAELKQNGIAVYDRGDLDAVQRRLREAAGVSVLVYQQTCATELRRRRKRDLIEDEKPRLVINEAVCEGCGDCSVQSNCVAVEPVETAFGLKRRINQTSCNKDLSCATGFCPAFVEVTGELKTPTGAALDVAEVRALAPEPAVAQAANILVTGVGGTGIVTLSALLAAAAKLDGKQVRTLDMTGLAQKGGAVFAHVRIATEEVLHSPRIPAGLADVLVGCDLVSAASNEALELLSERTQAVINSHVTPTADFVLSQSHDVQLRHRLARIKKVVGQLDSLAAEDHIENLLGDTQQANIMLLGSAYQAGGIPLSMAAIEEAITINGVATQKNLLAFHLGRVATIGLHKLPGTVNTPSRPSIPTRLAEVIEHRAAALVTYQNAALAQRYRALVDRVNQVEERVRPGSEQLTRAVAESYYKLLAIKDEYEVARLHIDDEFAESLRAKFGDDVKLKYLLAPPLMGASKRKFGTGTRMVFAALAAVRRVRNTWLDPFAYTAERRDALALVAHFEQLVDEILRDVDLQNLGIAVALSKLPMQVRGFGHVKAAHLRTAMREEARLLAEFRTPPTPVTLFDPRKQAA